MSATGIDSVKQLILPNVAAALRRHAGWPVRRVDCRAPQAPPPRPGSGTRQQIIINITQHHTQLTEQIVATHLDTDPNWICTP